MKTAVSLAVIALLISATVGILVVVHDVHRDLADAHTVVDEAGATLRAGHATIDKFNAFAGVEQKNAEKASQNTADATLDLRRVVAHFDRILTRVNTSTLDQLDAQIKGNGDALQSVIGNLGVTASKLGNTADGVTAVTDSLNIRINDPAIDTMLAAFNAAATNLSATSANLVVASANGASILGRTDHVAAYYEKKLTTPAGFFKTFFWTGLDLGSKAANIATAVK